MSNAKLSGKIKRPTAASIRGMLAKPGRTLPSETALKALMLATLKAKDDASKE
ncbi:hypothetical protein SAMN05216319_4264 [Duganella sp. CF402]|uniref:hypothetical protein n=1 Tax=unclassified Duganella TaxID=2636909 RepID=UPI0008B9620E|nr:MULTISPECIES: hypothetical protein [unclassified Duganella]RZT03958.1 hypothetical protein EV582_4839 [Duganella sp. BK701]SEM53506.1 hypothetical protein SAMN05216319_4264 [Duganella sp. CF402]